MTANKEHRGIVDSVSTLYEGEWTASSPGRLYPRRWSPQYPLNHRLCGPPVQSEEGENLLLLLGIEPKIIQPVAVYPCLLRGMHLLDTEFLYVKIVIMCTQERPETVPVSMKLENLTSYNNYTVSVVACTTACSKKSPPVTVATDIGGRLWACYCMFLCDNQ
jgi:hypothetical protein